MSASAVNAEVLRTTAGDFPLHEYRLGLGGRTWSVLHTDSVLTHEDEQSFLRERREALPYGVVLWPAAIALAHEIAARADRFSRHARAGAGRRDGAAGDRRGVAGRGRAADGPAGDGDVRLQAQRRPQRGGFHRHRLVDWTEWADEARYDWIIGSDILYGETFHPHLRAIFARNLAPGGRILLSDPFRATSLKLLETLEAEGWRVGLTKWSIGEEATPRPIGLFELQPQE